MYQTNTMENKPDTIYRLNLFETHSYGASQYETFWVCTLTQEIGEAKVWPDRDVAEKWIEMQKLPPNLPPNQSLFLRGQLPDMTIEEMRFDIIEGQDEHGYIITCKRNETTRFFSYIMDANHP